MATLSLVLQAAVRDQVQELMHQQEAAATAYIDLLIRYQAGLTDWAGLAGAKVTGLAAAIVMSAKLARQRRQQPAGASSYVGIPMPLAHFYHIPRAPLLPGRQQRIVQTHNSEYMKTVNSLREEATQLQEQREKGVEEEDWAEYNTSKERLLEKYGEATQVSC